MKRERSESPVKKSSTFAKWEQREQAEREQQTPRPSAGAERMDVSPKKIREDDWRKGIGKSEARSALHPVAQNVSSDKPHSAPHTPFHKRAESKENINYRPPSRDRSPSPSPQSHSYSRGLNHDTSRRPDSPEAMHAGSPPNRNSMATLSRSESLRASSKPARSRGHVRFTSTDVAASHLDGENFDQLQKSSTPQLRHLSEFASEPGVTEDLNVHSVDEQVVGLAGRRKLQRSGSIKPNAKKQSQFASQYTSTRWMDTQRKHLQAYEYLCHIGEARAWIEDVLEPTKLPPIVQLEEALRDGVTLAEVVVRLSPSLPSDQQHALGSQRIFRSPRLQFRHSDNIALFFRFLAEIELPELFRFELVDLYEKKNIPKVIYCIHALSWLLFRKGIVDFRIGNLLGQLQFEDHELEETQKGIDRSGVQMPNFGGMRAAMQIEEEPPPPEPTPGELLAEREESILELQTQIRGALVRLRLGAVMQDLWDAEEAIAKFQSLARAGFAREIFDFRYAMDLSIRRFQAASKAYLIRKRLQMKKSSWKANTPAVVKVQSLWRGKQQRAETKQIKSQLRSNRHGLKDLQAAIRGALGRWQAGDLWHETRDANTEAGVVSLQAIARGAVARIRIGALMNDLWDVEGTIVALQSALRGSQQRGKARSQKAATRQAAVEVVKLQAAVRGLLRRKHQSQQHGQWKLAKPNIVQTQALARGLLERLRQARTMGALQGRESAIVRFQTLARAQASRSLQLATKRELKSHSSCLSGLQALARAQAIRNQTASTMRELRKHDSDHRTFQSLARAMMERQRISRQLAALDKQEQSTVTLQSLARAYIERQRIFELLVEMEKEENGIVELQALSRAMLVRVRVGDLLAELDEHEAMAVELQSAIRGFVVRRDFSEKRKHYHENMQKVIKLQSYVRGKQQGESYKSLVNGKNPPLPVVRRHLHLLTDSNLEFESELESERLRRQVVESVRRNEMVESYVEGLDVKIALLVKNKITLDEVVKHQKHFGGSASQLLRSGSTLAHGHGIDLKALNKNSRKKLTGYEELFFMLQTQPLYLAKLFGQVTTRGISEKDGKNLERLIMTLFGYAQKSREECFLVKVLAASARQTISQGKIMEDYLRQQNGSFHQRLLLSYVRSPRDRLYLKTLLGSIVKNGICAQDHLDLESDPLQIYRAILNNEELSTGRPSQRPRDLPSEVVIRHEDVRARYVEHLEDLRDLGDNFFLNLEESLHRMPYGIRYIAKEQHKSLCEQFPREDPVHLAMMVGSWLWKSFILPALREPEMWGVVDRGLSPLHKRNLSQVITILSQVAGASRLFGAENLYLQPLNNWITESLQRWQECLSRLFDISSPEEHYDADQFSDLYSRNKPTLYIKLADVFALHTLVADNASAMATTRDDPIKEVLTDLGTPKSNENDFNGAATGGEITLTLKSRFAVQEDPNAEARQLFTATKRLVLYIIRVQSGSNLMEILLRPISHEDDDKWIALVQQDMVEKEREARQLKRNSAMDPRNASMRSARAQSVYSEAPSTFSEDRRDLHDFQSMTYAELKSTALENILALEQPSIPPQFHVSRHNNYQEILNALAADIRQKHRRRLERQRETETTRATIAQLDTKAAFLDDQLKSYNDYIEQCLNTLASKKGSKTKFVMPFTKQWSHERELERAGRQPKFGSYKYSARQLADKGVLLSWAGYLPEQWGQVNVVISSDEVGVFHLEASSGSMMLPGASTNLMLDDLLQAQYENKNSIMVFEQTSGGGAKLVVNLLLHLVFKKFYRDE